jgi:hypothetical protein
VAVDVERHWVDFALAAASAQPAAVVI